MFFLSSNISKSCSFIFWFFSFSVSLWSFINSCRFVIWSLFCLSFSFSLSMSFYKFSILFSLWSNFIFISFIWHLNCINSSLSLSYYFRSDYVLSICAYSYWIFFIYSRSSNDCWRLSSCSCFLIFSRIELSDSNLMDKDVRDSKFLAVAAIF